MALWVKLVENVLYVVNNAADKGYDLSKTYCAVHGANGCQPCHLTLGLQVYSLMKSQLLFY